MCGIGGIVSLAGRPLLELPHHLSVINQLQAHRGPDGEGTWVHPKRHSGFAHRRLSIIDIDGGAQPITDAFGNVITFNGEIYNYIELRKELESDFPFRTESDGETILAAYHKWGEACVDHLRGMFAFAIWDEARQELFCARDRFGIKPFYYAIVEDRFYFASEMKALLPFLPEIATDTRALQEYLVFQFTLSKGTLFKDIEELPPAHCLNVRQSKVSCRRYWEVYYELDFDHTAPYFERRLRELVEDSIRLHLRADVPVGAYVSGGIDSSLIASVASRMRDMEGYTGKFDYGPQYDESAYARDVANERGFPLHEQSINSTDFVSSIEKIIYHLDTPVAGPGSFPQYEVARLAAQHRKVVLGGQGGDEIFGGYTRYLVAYFEQCIKAAIDGTADSGNFIVTYDSIIPNLCALRNYKPMLKEFWRDGLFEGIDKRYYKLVNRAATLDKEICRDGFVPHDVFSTFQKIFLGNNVKKESYFDLMTHFDFKTLLPALLQVEDRMSMAHGLESRVPFLDHPLVEFAATIPSNIKFKDGTLKMALVRAMGSELPASIRNRKDKMGFPVPLSNWIKGELKDYVHDIFSSQCAKQRGYFNTNAIEKALSGETEFGRKIWGLLSLEIWHRQFHDQAESFRRLAKELPLTHEVTR